jgi:hypothetical protein
MASFAMEPRQNIRLIEQYGQFETGLTIVAMLVIDYWKELCRRPDF